VRRVGALCPTRSTTTSRHPRVRRTQGSVVVRLAARAAPLELRSDQARLQRGCQPQKPSSNVQNMLVARPPFVAPARQHRGDSSPWSIEESLASRPRWFLVLSMAAVVGTIAHGSDAECYLPYGLPGVLGRWFLWLVTLAARCCRRDGADHVSECPPDRDRLGPSLTAPRSVIDRSWDRTRGPAPAVRHQKGRQGGLPQLAVSARTRSLI